jgi:hydrogenase maturation protein HypF
MIQKGLNSPLTSSAGRLFDAVSSLLCQRHIISHESQAAMELEYVAAESLSDSYSSSEQISKLSPKLKSKLEYVQKPYSFSIIEKNNSSKNINSSDKYFEIDFMPCIREIVGDLMDKTSNNIISQKFHQTMITSFANTAKKIARQAEIDKIVLSGGVFNNNLILTGMIKALEENNLKVFTHSKVPTGDGGICLGQVVAAGAQMGLGWEV